MTGRLVGDFQNGGAIVPERLIGLVRPIPFEHRKFGGVKGATLAVAKYGGEREYLRLACRQKLLHRELGRRVQVKLLARQVGAEKLGTEGVQMRLVARRNLQQAGFNLQKTLRKKPVSYRGLYAALGATRNGLRSA